MTAASSGIKYEYFDEWHKLYPNYVEGNIKQYYNDYFYSIKKSSFTMNSLEYYARITNLSYGIYMNLNHLGFNIKNIRHKYINHIINQKKYLDFRHYKNTKNVIIQSGLGSGKSTSFRQYYVSCCLKHVNTRCLYLSPRISFALNMYKEFYFDKLIIGDIQTYNATHTQQNNEILDDNLFIVSINDNDIKPTNINNIFCNFNDENYKIKYIQIHFNKFLEYADYSEVLLDDIIIKRLEQIKNITELNEYINTLINNMKMTCYKNKSKSDTTDKYISSINNLHHEIIKNKYYNIVVIDESEGIINMLTSNLMKSTNIQAYKNLLYLMTYSDINFFMDAAPGPSTVQLINDMIDNDNDNNVDISNNYIKYVTNAHKGPERKLFIVQRNDKLKRRVHFNIIVRQINEGKKLYIYVSSKKDGYALQQYIMEHIIIKPKILFINGDTDSIVKENIFIDTEKIWSEHDVIITTSVTTVGISYTIKRFHSVHILASPYTSSRDAYQAHHRCRELLDDEVYISFSDQGILNTARTQGQKLMEQLNDSDAYKKLYISCIKHFVKLEAYNDIIDRTTDERILRLNKLNMIEYAQNLMNIEEMYKYFFIELSGYILSFTDEDIDELEQCRNYDIDDTMYKFSNIELIDDNDYKYFKELVNENKETLLHRFKIHKYIFVIKNMSLAIYKLLTKEQLEYFNDIFSVTI